MQFLILLVALLSAFVSALPTITDGRGATLFSSQHYAGTSGAIPSNSWCTNLNNVFFDLDGKARSIVVEKGVYCSFYVEYNCPAGGVKTAFGDKAKALGLETLPGRLDRNIRSVYCGAI